MILSFQVSSRKKREEGPVIRGGGERMRAESRDRAPEDELREAKTGGFRHV